MEGSGSRDFIFAYENFVCNIGNATKSGLRLSTYDFNKFCSSGLVKHPVYKNKIGLFVAHTPPRELSVLSNLKCSVGYRKLNTGPTYIASTSQPKKDLQ